VTKSEKRLLRIGLFLFIGYMLPFQFGPMAYDYYKNYRQSLDKLQRNIERYEKLGKKVEFWENTNRDIKQERDKIQAGLLPGDNRELVSVKMQELVTQLAKSSGLGFKSLERPDAYFTGDWALMVQTMKFETSSKNLMDFLNAVKTAKAYLVITKLDVRSFRSQLGGTIQITGFARLPLSETEE
jgi:hypothetical protein